MFGTQDRGDALAFQRGQGAGDLRAAIAVELVQLHDAVAGARSERDDVLLGLGRRRPAPQERVHNLGRLVVAEERSVLASHEIARLVDSEALVGRPNQVDVPAAVLPNSILVVSMLSANHVACARPATRAERITSVDQIVLELLVLRVLPGL